VSEETDSKETEFGDYEDEETVKSASELQQTIIASGSVIDFQGIANDLKKDIDSVIKELDNARQIAIEKEDAAEKSRVEAQESVAQVKSASDKLAQIKEKLLVSESIVRKIERTVESVKRGIEGVNEVTQELDKGDREIATKSLNEVLSKKNILYEEAVSELDNLKRLEKIALDKLEKASNDLSEIEPQSKAKTAEAKIIMANVENAINTIIKTYSDVRTATTDLLSGAVSPKSSD